MPHPPIRLAFAALVALGGCRACRDEVGEAGVEVTLGSHPVIETVLPDPSRIDAGESTGLYVDAWDPDGDPLAYAWTAGCDGSFDDPELPDPVFTLDSRPADDLCVLTVRVTDDRGGEATGAVQITTGPPLTPSTGGP